MGTFWFRICGVCCGWVSGAGPLEDVCDDEGARPWTNDCVGKVGADAFAACTGPGAVPFCAELAGVDGMPVSTTGEEGEELALCIFPFGLVPGACAPIGAAGPKAGTPVESCESISLCAASVASGAAAAVARPRFRPVAGDSAVVAASPVAASGKRGAVNDLVLASWIAWRRRFSR